MELQWDKIKQTCQTIINYLLIGVGGDVDSSELLPLCGVSGNGGIEDSVVVSSFALRDSPLGGGKGGGSSSSSSSPFSIGVVLFSSSVESL